MISQIRQKSAVQTLLERQLSLILFMHPEDIAILDLDKVSSNLYLVEERRLEHGKVIAITDEKLKRTVLDAIKNNKVKYHRGREK